MRPLLASVLVIGLIAALFGLRATSAAQPGSRLDQLKKDVIAAGRGAPRVTQQMVDSLFSFSELGFQEIETERYVTAILEKNGFTVRRGVAGHTDGVGGHLGPWPARRCTRNRCRRCADRPIRRPVW